MYRDVLTYAQPDNTPKYKVVKGSIYTVIILLICIGIFFMIRHFTDWKYDYTVFLLLLYPLYKLVIGIRLTQKYTKYQINHATLEVSKGAFFINREILPLDLMQSVSVTQGWIMKRFDLAEVTVYTRGSMSILPLMKHQDAEEVSTQIINRIKEIHYGNN